MPLLDFEPTPEELLAWIQRGREAKKVYEKHTEDARDNHLLYQGDVQAWLKQMPGGEAAVESQYAFIVNFVYTYVLSDAKRVYFKYPEWNASALQEKAWVNTPAGRAPISVAEAAVRVGKFATFLGSEIELHRCGRANFVSAMLSGEAWRKIGWLGTGDLYMTDPWVGPPTDEKDSGFPSRSKIFPRGVLMNSNVSPFLPFAVPVSEFSMTMDPRARSIEEANWLCQEIVVPIDDLKANPMYTNTAGLKPNTDDDVERALFMDARRQNDKDTRTGIRILEFHTRRAKPEKERQVGYSPFTHHILTIVPQDGLTKAVCIRHEPYKYDVGGYYFEHFVPDPIEGMQKGVPFVNRFKKMNGLYNYWFTYYQEWMSRVVPGYIGDGNAFDETEKRKFNLPLMHKIIWAKQEPKGALAPMQYETPPPEVAQIMSVTKAALDAMAMRSSMQMLQPTGTSATEVEELSAEAASQGDDLLQQIGRHEERTMLKLLRLVDANMPNGGLAIPSENGVSIQLEETDLKAPSLLKVTINSMQRKSGLVEQKLAMERLAILKQVNEVRPINFDPVVEQTLRATGYDNPSEVLKVPQPEPWEPKKEHLEMLAGLLPQIGEGEQLQTTLPEHEKYVSEIAQNPALKAAFFRPLPKGSPGALQGIPNAMQILIRHIAETRGQARLTGKGLASGALPGGGASAGRFQATAPNQGDMASAAVSMEVPGQGRGRGM